MRKHIVISVINDLVTDYRVHRVASTLIKSGAEITLIGRKLKGSLPLPPRVYNLKRMKLIFRKGPFFYFEFNFRLFFYLLFKKVDILLSNDLDTLPANYLISKIRNKILVYDSHEYFTEVPELVGRNTVKKIWINIEKRILPEIKYSYTVSASIAQEYHKKYGVLMQTIRNLPFYVDLQKPSSNPDYSEKKIIIYQGALNINRGIEYVIQAMKYLDDYLFLIAGHGDITGDLINQVQLENLQNKVQFLGKIPFSKLKTITGRARLGISLEEDLGLSYHYALPNKLFSYIQARIPVMVSDLPEMAAIVNLYKIGEIVKIHDPQIIARVIKDMSENIEKRVIWQNNLEIAARELCWEREEYKLVELFEKTGLYFTN